MIKDNRLQLKEKFLEYFREVPIQKYAGAYIGKDEDTIIIWKNEDSDFSDLIQFEKSEYLKKKLVKVQNPEWIIERLFKDHFSPRSELTGANGKPFLEVDINKLKTDYAKLADGIKRELGQQSVAIDQSLQNKDEIGGTENISTEPNPTTTS